MKKTKISSFSASISYHRQLSGRKLKRIKKKEKKYLKIKWRRVGEVFRKQPKSPIFRLRKDQSPEFLGYENKGV